MYHFYIKQFTSSWIEDTKFSFNFTKLRLTRQPLRKRFALTLPQPLCWYGRYPHSGPVAIHTLILPQSLHAE